MKTRSLFRRIALILMAAMVMVTLTSCGGDGQASGYNIMVASGYVDDEALESFGETLKQEIPELASEEVNASFSSTMLGSAESDPMMNMGALVGFDAKVAAGEITVAIFDKESAAREARGGIFRPISEILTEEDMEKLEGKLIDYETGAPFTAHTTNPVPFILVNADPSYTLREGGCLADIAPTLIELMGMEQPKEMTGKSLLIKK